MFPPTLHHVCIVGDLKLTITAHLHKYKIFFFYKHPLLVDYHETKLKIQTKRDQDKLERRHILTAEEQLKYQNR